MPRGPGTKDGGSTGSADAEHCETPGSSRSLRGRREATGVLCYAYVMAIKRITISVPETVAARIKKAAGAAPVSAWVTALIEERLDDAELERKWEAFYREVNPSRKDVRRAETMFRRLTQANRRKRVA